MKDKLALLLATAMLVSACASCSSDTTDVEEDADVADSSVAVEATVETDDDAEEVDEATYVYATMNIPYSDFYDAEINNDVPVDAVSSATTTKWQNFPATYFVSEGEGGIIYGPQCPVLISEDLFDELSALGETDDYYVSALDEEPTVYKEVSGEVGRLSFSAMIGGEDSTDPDAYAQMSYPSNWGDFQVEIVSDIIPESGPDNEATVYGVVVTTDDGMSYGLRSLENIWFQLDEISWASAT